MEENKQFAEILGLDVTAGLQYTGTWEIYELTLSEFHRAIPKRIQRLSDFSASGDLESYRIEVHSLKSSARTIGASALSDMARELEDKCRARDLDFIRENTEPLIHEYQKYSVILEPYKKPEPVSGEATADRGELMELCSRLLSALDDFDIDRAFDLVQEFYTYKVDDDLKEKLGRLKDAVDVFDYTAGSEVTREIMTSI